MNKVLSIALLLMLFFTSAIIFTTKNNETSLPPDSSTGKAAIGGHFTLTGTDGKQVTDAQFRGKYMLVFFGFTRCPDICPTTMATLTKAMEILGSKADLFTPLFISVDSAYDTPAQVKTFLANFDHRIVGLSGSEAQIKDVTSRYKAFYSAQEGGGGMMDHSALLYLMDKNGEYVTHYPSDTTPEALAKSLAGDVK